MTIGTWADLLVRNGAPLADVARLRQRESLALVIKNGLSSEAYPFPAMQTFVRQIYDAFGPQRMFWGTDITKMPCSWRQCVTMFTEELPWLSEPDKALIMGHAVCAWWGWDRPA